MKIELTKEEIELIDDALLCLVYMHERTYIFDEDEHQDHRKAYIAFDDAVCKTSEDKDED